ncbi:MAG: hypothetical protein JWM80_6674 [Cyanobacteria bacterium RYN_339]|nr:hypothetical protein [Cyanobacteria bacterium RYN_339]
MTKRFILVALAAAVLTGCGKVPVTAVAPHAKTTVKAPQPTVTLIRDTEFAANANDHQYDEQISAARQAIAGEMVKQGLTVPDTLATRHVAATSAKVTAVKVVQGPNGGAAAVVAAKGPDGKAIVVGAKDGNGNAIVAGAAKGTNGAAAAGVAVKGADGGEAGRWVATDGNGTVAWGAGAKDANGNAIGGTVVTKDGNVVASRWLKAANGDALLETLAYNPHTHVLVYSLTALVNGKLTTASATVVLPG